MMVEMKALPAKRLLDVAKAELMEQKNRELVKERS